MSVLRAVHEAATDPIVWPASAVFGFASLAISSAAAAVLSVPVRLLQRRRNADLAITLSKEDPTC